MDRFIIIILVIQGLMLSICKKVKDYIKGNSPIKLLSSNNSIQSNPVRNSLLSGVGGAFVGSLGATVAGKVVGNVAGNALTSKTKTFFNKPRPGNTIKINNGVNTLTGTYSGNVKMAGNNKQITIKENQDSIRTSNIAKAAGVAAGIAGTVFVTKKISESKRRKSKGVVKNFGIKKRYKNKNRKLPEKKGKSNDNKTSLLPNKGGDVYVDVADISFLYNLRNSNVMATTNANSALSLQGIGDKSNKDRMSQKQKNTVHQAVNILMDKNGTPDNNMLQVDGRISEKERFLTQAVMMADLSPDQAARVAEKVSRVRDKKMREERSNAVIQVLDSEQIKDEKRKVVEELLRKNSAVRSNFDRYYNEFGDSISEERKKEIFSQAEQIVGGNVPDSEEVMKNERIKTILNDKSITNDKEKVRAIEEALIEIETENDRKRCENLFIDRIAADPNGPEANKLFNSQELKAELSSEINKTNENAINGVISKEKRDRIDVVYNEYPELKGKVSPYELEALIEEIEEYEMIEQAIKEEAPDVEVKSLSQYVTSQTQEVSTGKNGDGYQLREETSGGKGENIAKAIKSERSDDQPIIHAGKDSIMEEEKEITGITTEAKNVGSTDEKTDSTKTKDNKKGAKRAQSGKKQRQDERSQKSERGTPRAQSGTSQNQDYTGTTNNNSNTGKTGTIRYFNTNH